MATATKESDDLRKQLGVVPIEQTVEFLNILIYGEPGVGKTVLAGTANEHPDTSPMLYANIEGGSMSIRKQKGIDTVPIQSVADLEAVHQKLHMDKSRYYKTFVVDTINELFDLDMKFVIAERDKKRPDLKGEPASQREWGIARDHMRKIVRAFRDLPMNTIYIAHSATDKDDQISTFAPMLPGKLQKEIPGFMDIVAYMTADVKMVGSDMITERRLQLAKTKRVMAKDRTDTLGQSIEDPTIPKLWELLHA